MRLEHGRSEWLMAVYPKWITVSCKGGFAYAPYVYIDYREGARTLLSYRLDLSEPFRTPELARATLVAQVFRGDDEFPAPIRDALRRVYLIISPWVKLVEKDGRITAIEIETWAEGQVNNPDAWCRKVVKRLLGDKPKKQE